MSFDFNIETIINKLRKKRQVFCSEADLQLEMAWTIKETYPNVKVRLEYVPNFDETMHIDIVVFSDDKWIPIELKYKTKSNKNKNKGIKDENGETFYLKNQSAKNRACYLYLKDIERIERIKKEKENNFKEGYAIFITNDECYKKEPKGNCFYKKFSIHDGAEKHGELEWEDGCSALNEKQYKEPIKLKSQSPYKMEWKEFSKVYGDENIRIFYYLVNKIIKN